MFAIYIATDVYSVLNCFRMPIPSPPPPNLLSDFSWPYRYIIYTMQHNTF